MWDTRSKIEGRRSKSHALRATKSLVFPLSRVRDCGVKTAADFAAANRAKGPDYPLKDRRRASAFDERSLFQLKFGQEKGSERKIGRC
jgi:hypothetical protein